MDFTAAKDYLEKRLNMPTDMTSRVISEEIPAQVRAHCFFSARVAESKVLDQLRGVSDAYSRGEIDLATARMKFKKWYDREKPGQRFADGEGITNIASTMRLNLVMRQNAAMAAGVGRYQVSRDPAIEERWPCWRYITGPNARDAHAALDGKVFLKSDPIWHRIYPPWEFNCNCDVEDAELPENGADKIKAEAVPESDSGFKFDPAEAFRKIDLSLLDKQAKVDFELAYGGDFELDGKYAVLQPVPTSRISSKSLGLPSATTWTDVPNAPGLINQKAAEMAIRNGITIKDVKNDDVTINSQAIAHWESKTTQGDREKDIKGRLERLSWAIDTLKHPKEVWTDIRQKVYISVYLDDESKKKGFIVAVKNTGVVNTYYIDGIKRVDLSRKGVNMESFERKNLPSFKRVSLDDLLMNKTAIEDMGNK